MEQNGTAFTIQGNFIDAARREREREKIQPMINSIYNKINSIGVLSLEQADKILKFLYACIQSLLGTIKQV